MGTNYYISCKCCASHMKHIGKSSCGWPFTSMYADIEAIFYDLDEMNDGGDKYAIMDEYHRELTKEEFVAFVEGRTWHDVQMGWLKVDREFS